VIGLNGIIEVLLDEVASGGQELIDDSTVGARSVFTFVECRPCLSAREKNRRLAPRSRLGDTSTSTPCPY
jgi:hypothetical protein